MQEQTPWFSEGKPGWLDESPCSKPVADFTCVGHEKNQFSPSAFPTVKACVRTVLVSGPGIIYHLVIWQADNGCRGVYILHPVEILS